MVMYGSFLSKQKNESAKEKELRELDCKSFIKFLNRNENGPRVGSLSATNKAAI